MHTTYRSGEWFLLVTPDAIVALPPQVPADVVTALWDRMPQHPTLATVLESVGAGGDFTALPAFVAVLAEGTGVNSIGSCSTVGPGGQTGCFVQNARRSRAEAKQRNEAATPDLTPY